MKNTVILLFSLIFSSVLLAQDGRVLLRGEVLYKNTGIPNENVINTTTGVATVTDTTGAFAINVKEGDQLAFTAINYQLKVVPVTAEILRKARLVVEITEKVRVLGEVVVTPDNQERFLELKNEKFKSFDYDIDRSTAVENIAQAREVRGMRDGLNFVNIFKALFASREAKGSEVPPLKLSEVLRQLYDDAFFVVDLQLPQDKIGEFLLYCDQAIPSQALLRKKNEFQLIDFLVTQSKAYLATLNEE